jgi:hypothetical protein
MWGRVYTFTSSRISRLLGFRLDKEMLTSNACTLPLEWRVDQPPMITQGV